MKNFKEHLINEANSDKRCIFYGIDKIKNIKELGNAFIEFGNSLLKNEDNIKQIHISQSYDADELSLWIRDDEYDDIFKKNIKLLGVQK